MSVSTWIGIAPRQSCFVLVKNKVYKMMVRMKYTKIAKTPVLAVKGSRSRCYVAVRVAEVISAMQQQGPQLGASGERARYWGIPGDVKRVVPRNDPVVPGTACMPDERRGARRFPLMQCIASTSCGSGSARAIRQRRTGRVMCRRLAL